MPQSNLSFEQRNFHGPVTSTPKNCIHQVLITYNHCHHEIILKHTFLDRMADGFIHRHIHAKPFGWAILKTEVMSQHMSGFYRGCCTFIFTHHKEIVPYLLSSQNPQLQDTPGSKTHCVGFYPCFQADCEQLGQLTLYRSSDTYTLSMVLSQTLGHHSALWLVQLTHTRCRGADWLKITTSKTQDHHCCDPGSGDTIYPKQPITAS